MVLELKKALYDLKELLLLWQKYLTETLKVQGFKTVPYEPCCMTKDGIVIFFYVDDIVITYYQEREPEVRQAINHLK